MTYYCGWFLTSYKLSSVNFSRKFTALEIRLIIYIPILFEAAEVQKYRSVQSFIK
jgi:hypothetical protein